MSLERKIDMPTRENLISVVFQLGRSDWHSHGTESLWATPLGRGRCRLENTPFYVYGVSYHDVVFVETLDSLYMFQSVAEPGGHSTYRIFLEEGVDHEFEELWTPLKTLGCSYERGTDYLLAVDVPPEADIYRVYEGLEKGESAGIWDFEEGHCGHPLNSRKV